MYSAWFEFGAMPSPTSTLLSITLISSTIAGEPGASITWRSYVMLGSPGDTFPEDPTKFFAPPYQDGAVRVPGEEWVPPQ